MIKHREKKLDLFCVSVDSRDLSVGYVRKDQVVGRAVIKAWPPARMKIWK